MGDPEPDPKKLKMSTTASDDGDCALTSAKKPRYKRRKIAIFLAYCGAGYQGMQKNPGAKTIEGDLEEALYHSGAVPEQDWGCPKRLDWARSARTDKGVSAAGQVVSGRFYVDPPCLVRRLNASLPPQIRIFGFQRVTSSFNAKRFCDRRRYVYLIPVFALDPCSHRDRESVVASVGSENELVKCVECSEKGRKKFEVMGEYVSKNGVIPDISSNSGAGESFLGGLTVSENGVKLDILSNSEAAALESTTSNDELRRVSENAISELDILFENNETFLETTTIKNEIRDSENADIKINISSSNSGAVVSEPPTIVDEMMLSKSSVMKPNILYNTEAAVLNTTTNDGIKVSENSVRIEISSDMEAAVFETTKPQEESRVSKNNFTQNLSLISEAAALFDATVGDKIRVSENNSLEPDIPLNGVVFEPTLSIVDEVRVSSSESIKEPKPVIANNSGQKSSADQFRYGEKEKQRFNRILANYVGTHNFHNFTTRTKAEDPAAHRFIISFNASTIVTVDGIDFVKCEILGQSFMLHQIRKMIGLAVAIMRNFAPESLLPAALQKDLDMNVPTAPEVGLYLDECFFSSYNEKWKDSHEALCMKPYEEEAEEFKMKHIYSHIASTESMEGVVGLWLHSLNSRNYPDLNQQTGKIANILRE